MPYRTFQLSEVAHYLHLTRADIERLVKQNEIPFEQPGGRLVFRQREIDAWASQRILGFSDKHLADFHRASSAKAHDLSKQHAIIAELARAPAFDPALASKTKPAILRDMTQLADRTGLVGNPLDLLHSLEEREHLCSTALADGIALLHPRHHDPYMFDDSFIALGRTVRPVPFGAPDGRLTDLFFLICCQDDRLHLHVLARMCVLCKQTQLLAALRTAGDADGLYDALRGAEEAVIRQMS